MSKVFLQVLNMSFSATWLMLAVILVRLLFKEAPKYIRCILWALVAIRLVCPFSIESEFSMVPESNVGSIYETIDSPVSVNEVTANENEKNVTEQNETVIGEDNVNVEETVQNQTDSNIYYVPETDGTSIDTDSSNTIDVETEKSFNFRIVLKAIPYVWLLGIIGLLGYSLLSFIILKKRVKVSMQLDNNIFLCDGIDSPFIMGLVKPCIYLPSTITTSELEYVIAHEKAHLKRMDNWWKLIGFVVLTIHWFNPLVWISYVLFCRDVETACDERVIKNMSSDYRKAYSTALLYYSVPHKNMLVYPLAFGDIGVKDRVKSVLNYKEPAFWVVVVGIITCIVVAIFFLTNPKSEETDELTYASIGILGEDAYYFDNAQIYPSIIVNSFSDGNAYPLYQIRGGGLYYCPDYRVKLEWIYIGGNGGKIELTKNNFDKLIDLPEGSVSFINELSDEGIEKYYINTESFRKSNKYAWIITGGERGDYLLMEQNDGSVYIANCMLQNGKITYYFDISLMQEMTEKEIETINGKYTEQNKLLEEYGSHLNECVNIAYYDGLYFEDISMRTFQCGDDRLYIEPTKIDEEHYSVFIHLEDAAGNIDTFEYKVPTVREPLKSAPEIVIKCENDSTSGVVETYDVDVNNWLDQSNGRTNNLFNCLSFNDKNTLLFNVPNWTEFNAGQFTITFPEGQAPDLVDVEDMVLNEDGSIRYPGKSNEVVFRGATVDRINDVVTFSLADHSSISMYEELNTADAMAKPFYRGYKARCYWATTEGMQSVTYFFVIRTQKGYSQLQETAEPTAEPVNDTRDEMRSSESAIQITNNLLGLSDSVYYSEENVLYVSFQNGWSEGLAFDQQECDSYRCGCCIHSQR